MTTKDEAIKKLKEMETGGDNEAIHGDADDILLEFTDPDVKKAYINLKKKVAFWYA